MASQTPWFYDAGITKSSIEMRGRVVVQPAKKLAKAPLGMLYREYGFRFIIPHIMYDEGLSWDPVSEYASFYRLEVPCVYWDAPIRLLRGLKRPETKSVANRIYAINREDIDKVLNCANASLFLNPAHNIACRLGYTELPMLDFNRPVTGSLTEDDVQLSVTFWTIRYANLTVAPVVDKSVNSVPESFRVNRTGSSEEGLSKAVQLIREENAAELTEAIDRTEMGNRASRTDVDVES